LSSPRRTSDIVRASPTREVQFPTTPVWPRHAMKLSTDCPHLNGAKPIPPLSQSRHGDMACETLYVHKHVQSARLAESEAAARGIEIHQILATYTNHLVSARRSTDVEVFDGLMRGAGAEAREVLEKFR